jgi:hypothetical protein
MVFSDGGDNGFENSERRSIKFVVGVTASVSRAGKSDKWSGGRVR